MNRFGNLEFGTSTDAETNVSTGVPTATAEGYMQAAERAWHSYSFEPALRAYTRALREDRSLVAAWAGQAFMLVELGEHEEARLWSDKALELFPGHGDLLAAKAQACSRLNDRRAALACSDGAVAAPGSSTRRWQCRGEVLLARRDRRAVNCFERSYAEADACWFDRVVASRIHLYHGIAVRALEHAQQAVELAPDRCASWLALGQSQAALGWSQAGTTSLRHAVELDPGVPAAQQALDAIRRRGAGVNAIRRILGALRR